MTPFQLWMIGIAALLFYPFLVALLWVILAYTLITSFWRVFRPLIRKGWKRVKTHITDRR